MKKNADLLLTANISSYSASLISVNGFFSTLPTVLIAMSILPKRCFASSNSFSTAAAVVRSPWNVAASAPAARTATAVSSACACDAALL